MGFGQKIVTGDLEVPAGVVAPKPTRTADVLAGIIEEVGVRAVFGLPGGTIAPLHDALLDVPSIQTITARHESGAVFAAAAYAWATGGLGVVAVTSGPGVINAMTGLASAYCDGLPLLVLAGEVPTKLHGKGALQEGSAHHLDVVGMSSSITKLAMSICEPNAAPAIMRRAIATAMSGRRGPVLLTLPLDVTKAKIFPPRISSTVNVSFRPDPRVIGDAAEALAMAERPVILAGAGARWGDGPEQLARLACRLQAPVMTTPKAKGVFPESHRLSLGVFGHGGHPSSAEYLKAGVDVVLSVASGLKEPATNGWSELLRPSRSFIQIDADAQQIGRSYRTDIGLVGRAEDLLRLLANSLPQAELTRAASPVRSFTDPQTTAEGDDGRITPQRVLWEVQRSMPTNTVYTSDIGEHLLYATHYLRIDDPRGFLIMNGLASMGSGIGGAVGLKAGMRERPVVAICGDGCFAMHAGEVATAAENRLNVLFVVLNDNRYGMVEMGNEAIFGRTPEYAHSTIDIQGLAASMGATTYVVERANTIPALDLCGALEHGPVVIEARVDRSARMPKNERIMELAK